MLYEDASVVNLSSLSSIFLKSLSDDIMIYSVFQQYLISQHSLLQNLNEMRHHNVSFLFLSQGEQLSSFQGSADECSVLLGLYLKQCLSVRRIQIHGHLLQAVHQNINIPNTLIPR